MVASEQQVMIEATGTLGMMTKSELFETSVILEATGTVSCRQQNWD